MELVQLTNEMWKVNARIEKAGVELYKLAKIKAETEAQYQLEKSKEILKLKTEGMSITLIPDIVKGNLYELLLARDLADAQFTAGRDILSSLQTQATLLQTMTKFQGEI